MPNWCSNWTHFRHTDKTQLEQLKQAAYEDRLFDEYVPDIDNDWYKQKSNLVNWGTSEISAWGTKLDMTANPEHAIEYDPDTGMHTLSIGFSTAWTPPLALYEKLVAQGWQVNAYYFEPGMNFCGKWDNGVDDRRDIPATAEEAMTSLPYDLEEVFNICEMLAERQ